MPRLDRGIHVLCAAAPLIGCPYITPIPRASDDCAVYFWLARSHDARAAEMKAALEGWLRDEWHFDAVAFPGSDVPWAEWR